MTFSIVARDATNGDLGVAVASKFLAVGAIVPWARAGVGAIATQSHANPTFGPRGLTLLSRGRSAAQALDALVKADRGREKRQVGIVDASGGSATHTGAGCHAWAGGRAGAGYACQGNILVGKRVVDAMEASFTSTRRAGSDLATRLLAALRAGDDAGGDKRGRQSAALLIVREKGGYGSADQGWDFDRMIDLRSDDHARPVDELEALLSLWRLSFERSKGPGVALTGRAKAEVTRHLRRLGRLRPDEALTLAALDAFLDRENFEERRLDGWRLDTAVLAWLRDSAKRESAQRPMGRRRVS